MTNLPAIERVCASLWLSDDAIVVLKCGEVRELLTALDTLTAERDGLRSVLSYYADDQIYDGGRAARAALDGAQP